MAVTQGRRVESPFAEDGSLIGEWPSPGDYFLAPYGWCGVAPDGRIAGLSKHTIVEHEDKTITVSPSILVYASAAKPEWHGYLERGVWREC